MSARLDPLRMKVKPAARIERAVRKYLRIETDYSKPQRRRAMLEAKGAWSVAEVVKRESITRGDWNSPSYALTFRTPSRFRSKPRRQIRYRLVRFYHGCLLDG